MKEIQKILFTCLALILVNLNSAFSVEIEEDSSSDLYVIEGKVFPWENAANPGWQLMTHVMANGGEYYGFLRYFLIILNQKYVKILFLILYQLFEFSIINFYVKSLHNYYTFNLKRQNHIIVFYPFSIHIFTFVKSVSNIC